MSKKRINFVEAASDLALRDLLKKFKTTNEDDKRITIVDREGTSYYTAKAQKIFDTYYDKHYNKLTTPYGYG
jgi:hypothetical protein